MSDDNLDHIPSIVPTRDGEPRQPRGSKRSGRPGKGDNGSRKSGGGGGSGLFARLVMTVALVVAAVACAWAFQLQKQLDTAAVLQDSYEARLADLEDRLSDTDEGMNQSAAVQAAKIRELDSEIRKLWDNVWKKAKARLDKLERENSSQAGKISAQEKSLAAANAQLKTAAADLEKLRSMSGDLQRLVSGASASQAEVERVADDINRLNLEYTRLEKRVKGNEEWVGSINAFRRQVNGSISNIQATLRNLQAPPGAATQGLTP